VEQSGGLRRDGAWEHGVLQQRAAGEAALHEPTHVCLLMHVGAAQARTRLQERQRVSPAEKVREMHAVRASYHARLPDLVSVYFGGGWSTRIYVDSGKCRGLVRLCGVMRRLV
jgi:hypothetical protein